MVRYVVRTTQVPFTPITYNFALRNLKLGESHAATVLLDLQKRRSCKSSKCVKKYFWISYKSNNFVAQIYMKFDEFRRFWRGRALLSPLVYPLGPVHEGH